MLARSVHSSSTDERANDFFEMVVAILAGDIPGIIRNADDIRRQMTDAARGWVVSIGADPEAFDRAGADPSLLEPYAAITVTDHSPIGRTASAA